MESDRFSQAMAIFEEACAGDLSQRSALLAERCGDDEQLRAEVESLLRFDERPVSPLVQAGGGVRALAAYLAEDADGAGGRTSPALPILFGRYRVLRVLGEGGMGVVYEAEQAVPRRRVALKAIRPGMASQQMLRRFEQEVHILGRLHHPGIAQIYEAGVADGDHPDQAFFAMEYVPGERLTDAANRMSLPVRQRLMLMIKVCEAVRHAHQRGVIHRDLKPANILLVDEGINAEGNKGPEDSGIKGAGPSFPFVPQPKILDFGVARLIEEQNPIGDRAWRNTQDGQLVGTLAFMSPEQLDGDPDEVDTRTDIYSLGIILYELLAGVPPHDVRDLSFTDALMRIRSSEPPMLGTIQRGCRGDIETIVAKAIEKDKARRYQSVQELAGDLTRYLQNEPITARPSGTFYQIRKFASRHRALVAGLGAVIASLSIGIILATREAAHATSQRIRAEQAESQSRRDAELAGSAARRSQQVSRFMQNILALADPRNSRGKDMTVREALDQAATRVASELSEDPLVAADIRATVGRAYKSLGRYDDAEPHFRAALDLRRRALGPAHPDIAASLYDLASDLRRMNRPQDGLEFAQASLDMYRSLQGEASPEIASGLVMIGDLSRALGRFEEAEASYHDGLEMLTEKLHIRDNVLVAAETNFGLFLMEEYRYDEAAEMMSKAYRLAGELSEEDTPQRIAVGNNLGFLLLDRQRFAEAEPILQNSLDMAVRLYGDRHPDTLRLMASLAHAKLELGEIEAAEALARQSLEFRRSLGPSAQLAVAESLMLLGDTLARRGSASAEEALGYLDEAIAIWKGNYTTPTPLQAGARSVRGECLMLLGRVDEAEPLLAESVTQLRVMRGRTNRETKAAAQRLLRLYEQTNQTAKAAELRDQLIRETGDEAHSADGD